MKEAILEKVKEYEKIIIHRHVRPDPDAYGSQGGLAELLKESFPGKTILAAGLEDESLFYLNRMDEVDESDYEGALVIVCDTANQGRICGSGYEKGDFLIKIDHHPNVDAYGDLLWVDTDASSTSEMIYELYLFGKDKGLVLNQNAARLIYAGIVGDTGRFLFPSTRPKTLRYAAELMETGFVFPELYTEMYKMKEHVAHLQGYILQNFEMLPCGGAYVKLTKELLGQFNAVPADASQLVGSLGNIEGMKAWVFFVEEEDQIRVRFRSKGPVVNSIAARYNGGGHPLAAGASIYSWEDAGSVLEDLQQACEKFEKGR